MPGVWYPSTRCLVIDTRYTVPCDWCLVTGNRCLVPGVQCLVPSEVDCLLPSAVDCLVPSDWCLVAGAWSLVDLCPRWWSSHPRIGPLPSSKCGMVFPLRISDGMSWVCTEWTVTFILEENFLDEVVLVLAILERLRLYSLLFSARFHVTIEH